MRCGVELEGYEKSRKSWPLHRHALERRDQGYSAFMQAILSPEDWAHQQSVSAS
jgi:hypothetical protein